MLTAPIPLRADVASSRGIMERQASRRTRREACRTGDA